MKKKNRFRLVLCATVAMMIAMSLAVTAHPAMAAEATKYIRNDSTGGDCTTIGTWIWWGDSGRCILNRDLTFAGNNGIVIVDKWVELNGDGHTITGSRATYTTGITLNGIQEATVYNIRVENFYTGLLVSGGSGHYIMWGCQFNNNVYAGVNVANSTGNLIEANTMSSNRTGVLLSGGSNNAVLGNTVESNSVIGIQGSGRTTGNNISTNTVRSNATGIFLNDSPGNHIYRNNFLNNTRQAQVGSIGGRPYDNFFSYPLPTGGNYWSDFDSPAEGCSDADANGFCDATYIITGSRASDEDELPRTTPFV